MYKTPLQFRTQLTVGKSTVDFLGVAKCIETNQVPVTVYEIKEKKTHRRRSKSVSNKTIESLKLSSLYLQDIALKNSSTKIN
jgi:hypothetical protein